MNEFDDDDNDERDERITFAESVVNGTAHTQLWQQKYENKKSMKKLLARQKQVLEQLRQSVQVSADYQQEIAIAQLQNAFTEALRLGEVAAAVSARKELNLLLNLYQQGQQGTATLHDELAALTDAELEAEARALLGEPPNA